jgi:hypothetical protein
MNNVVWRVVRGRAAVALIQKQYFRLDEVAHVLGLSGSDIIYLAENGHMRLSIRVFGLVVEVGDTEEIGPGDWQAWPHGEELRAGLLDLWERDAHQALKAGTAEVRSFHAPSNRYCCLPSGSASVLVTREDLLVRGEERQRLESLLQQQAPAPAFQNQQTILGFEHSPDYRMVRWGGEAFSLGRYQSHVVRLLHHAALAGQPWCRGVDILSEIECSTLRMSDLFKSKRGWRTLIESNSRGMYRLAATAKP